MNQGFQRFLRHWFQSKAGQVLFNHEQQLVDQALDNKFGYYLVQLGCVSQQSLVQNSRVSSKLLVDEHSSTHWLQTQGVKWVQAEFDFLPIARDSVDVVLLPHTLETVDDPYYLLRQVDQMLLPEGHVVLTGFNLIGCLPLRFSYFSKRGEFGKARLRRASKIKEWLEVLGYEVGTVRYTPVMCFAATEKYRRWAKVIEKVERSLSHIGLNFGNVYCLIAKKKVDAPTLVGMKWKLPSLRSLKGRAVASQTAKPSSKNLTD